MGINQIFAVLKTQNNESWQKKISYGLLLVSFSLAKAENPEYF